MQLERSIKGMRKVIMMRVLPKTLIEKMLLRRHNPNYINKSVIFVCRNRVTTKDVWGEKHSN